jgi:hypothetical protein
MGHRGYGEGEVIAGFSAKVEKPQKGPEGGNQLLRRRNAALAGALQKKISYGFGLPLINILTQRLD